ncbi:MAG: hypothetical protein AB1938_02905 [Myxococcota bacterium]
MQGEEATPSPATDRERRARLERLQEELRAAKAQLAAPDRAAAESVADVEASLGQDRARLARAQARAKELEAQSGAALARIELLRPLVEEARVLARGARSRGYREWDTRNNFLGGLFTLLFTVVLGGGYGLLVGGKLTMLVFIGSLFLALFLLSKFRKGA